MTKVSDHVEPYRMPVQVPTKFNGVQVDHGDERPLEIDSQCLPIVCQIGKQTGRNKEKPLKTSMFSRASVVAGVGFEPTTFRL